VVAGQRILDLKIDAPRGGAIEGTVLDEAGVPIPTSQVTAWQRIYVGGVPQFVAATNTPSRAITDDRGRYRLYGLPPGDYVVSGGGGGAALMGAEIASDDEIRTADEEVQRVAGTAAPPGPPKPRQVRTVTRAGGYAPGSMSLGSSRSRLLKRTTAALKSPTASTTARRYSAAPPPWRISCATVLAETSVGGAGGV